MSTCINLRNASQENCKLICKYLNHDDDLWRQKYLDIISMVERNNRNIAFMAPEEFYRLVYNKSVNILNDIKPI